MFNLQKSQTIICFLCGAGQKWISSYKTDITIINRIDVWAYRAIYGEILTIDVSTRAVELYLCALQFTNVAFILQQIMAATIHRWILESEGDLKRAETTAADCLQGTGKDKLVS